MIVENEKTNGREIGPLSVQRTGEKPKISA